MIVTNPGHKDNALNMKSCTPATRAGKLGRLLRGGDPGPDARVSRTGRWAALKKQRDKKGLEDRENQHGSGVGRAEASGWC